MRSVVIKLPNTPAALVDPTAVKTPLLMVVFPVTVMELVKLPVAVLAIRMLLAPDNVMLPPTVMVFAVAFEATVNVPAPVTLKFPATPILNPEPKLQVVDAPPTNSRLL